MIRFRPVGDRILVEPIESKKETIGSIYIPESVRTQDASAEGVVVKLGTGKVHENGKRTQFEVKEGDRVFFSRFNGTEVKVGNKMFKLLEPNEILAVIE